MLMGAADGRHDVEEVPDEPEMGADGAGRRLCARLPRGVGGNGRGGDAPAAAASLPTGDGTRSVGAVRADGGERVRERLGAGDSDGTGCVERGAGEPEVGDAADTAGTELRRCRPGGRLLPPEPGGLLAGRWHRRC